MTISANDNTKLIKDWIRPLQKSLTIETENKFINTLGREKYFSDYLHESLKYFSLPRVLINLFSVSIVRDF